MSVRSLGGEGGGGELINSVHHLVISVIDQRLFRLNNNSKGGKIGYKIDRLFNVDL